MCLILSCQANLPVCMGKARSRQQSLREGDYSQEDGSSLGDKVLCVHVHGDAAYAAQVMPKDSQEICPDHAICFNYPWSCAFTRDLEIS